MRAVIALWGAYLSAVGLLLAGSAALLALAVTRGGWWLTGAPAGVLLGWLALWLVLRVVLKPQDGAA